MTDAPAQNSIMGWLSRRGRWQRLGLSILLGALMTLGHAPVSVPWVLFLSVPPLVLMVQTATTGRAAAWIGWGAAFGYFVTGLHWMGHAFLVDPDRFAWLLPIGVTALPAGFGLFWALAFWVAKRLAPRGQTGQTILIVGLWSAAEYLRSTILTGFPWALPGYVWVDLPPMQAAAWIGPHGMTLVTLAITAITGVALIARRPVFGAAALAAASAMWVAGMARIPDTVAYEKDARVLRIVQPNAPQHLKWKKGHYQKFTARLLEATERPAGDLGPPDIVLWPETAVQLIPATSPGDVQRISQAAGNAWILLGALHGAAKGGRIDWTNALVTISPHGELGPLYAKHHLVPFGEYLPLASVFDALGLSQFAIRGGFSRGPGPQTIELAGVPGFSPLICYEAIFPHEVVGPDRPDWLLQPTNDAWFGSWAGPHQHYAQARIRAIEQGLPIVRAANTGISAVVDPYGRQLAFLPLHVFDHLDARLPAPLAPTLYSRFGDWIALALIFGCILGPLVLRARA